MVNDAIRAALEKAADVIITNAPEVAGGLISEHSVAQATIAAFLRALPFGLYETCNGEPVDMTGLADAVEGAAGND